jgi:cytochrome c oxidase subunit IV
MIVQNPATQKEPAISNAVVVYGAVWLILLFLTAVTVAAANFNIGKLTVMVCLGIASIKSILVFLYFMHLRHEQRLIIKLIVPIALVTLAIFIGLTFSDIFTRS